MHYFFLGYFPLCSDDSSDGDEDDDADELFETTTHTAGRPTITTTQRRVGHLRVFALSKVSFPGEDEIHLDPDLMPGLRSGNVLVPNRDDSPQTFNLKPFSVSSSIDGAA